MTEQEYINATNLAKIRAAKAVLRDLFPSGPLTEKDLDSILGAAIRIEDKLAKAVTTTN